MQLYCKFNLKEVNELKKNISIVTDSREQQNLHITNYFEDKNIKYTKEKLDQGDYGVKIPAILDFGITKELYVPVVIERKASIDELATNLGTDRERFQKELDRAMLNKQKLLLMVEDPDGYFKILNGSYRSDMKPNAFMASLKAYEARYGFQTTFIKKELAASYIYSTLLYHAREYLIEW